MVNKKTIVIAAMIAHAFPVYTVEIEKNVLTLEDSTGDRFIITVESMFEPTAASTPLPE